MLKRKKPIEDGVGGATTLDTAHFAAIDQLSKESGTGGVAERRKVKAKQLKNTELRFMQKAVDILGDTKDEPEMTKEDGIARGVLRRNFTRDVKGTSQLAKILKKKAIKKTDDAILEAASIDLARENFSRMDVPQNLFTEPPKRGAVRRDERPTELLE